MKHEIERDRRKTFDEKYSGDDDEDEDEDEEEEDEDEDDDE